MLRENLYQPDSFKREQGLLSAFLFLGNVEASHCSVGNSLMWKQAALLSQLIQAEIRFLYLAFCKDSEAR